MDETRETRLRGEGGKTITVISRGTRGGLDGSACFVVANGSHLAIPMPLPRVRFKPELRCPRDACLAKNYHSYRIYGERAVTVDFSVT